jgi:hypothetical protein
VKAAGNHAVAGTPSIIGIAGFFRAVKLFNGVESGILLEIFSGVDSNIVLGL